MPVLYKHRFWICVALSVAIHGIVLTEMSGQVGLQDPPSPSITAQIVVAESTPVEPPAPRASPAPPQRRAEPVRVAPLPPAITPLPGPAILSPAPAAVPEPAAETPQAESPPEPPAAQPETPAPTPPAPPAVAQANATTRPVRDLPASGSINYDLLVGEDKANVGLTTQTWAFDKGTYRLTSFSKATGITGFFFTHQFAYISEGRADAGGLHPDQFSVRRGRNGTRQFAARFDWAGGELTLGPVDAPRKMALPEGTLDLISFIYQLARAELAPGQIKLSVTNGIRIDALTLDIGAEEPIELPGGMVQAVPVRQVRIPGQESMEIWFAPARGYLPVRIRFLDRRGAPSVEFVANKVAVDAR